MKIGFIGTGNMGQALIKGYIGANPGFASNIFAYDINKEGMNALVSETGIHGCNNIKEIVNNAHVLILAVKPNVLADTLKEIVESDGWEEKIIVSIAAGISLDYIREQCKDISAFVGYEEDFCCKAVRVMPNTPALIGKGMSGLSRNSYVADEEFKEVMSIFSAVSKVEEVDENLMDSVVGVSGSAPAYVYMFIEALADGAVALGMDRKRAYEFAATTVAGSAEMVLKSGLHPGELKDKVCSPGGTTIEAVETLESNGFRKAVIAAVKAAGVKSKEMTK